MGAGYLNPSVEACSTPMSDEDVKREMVNLLCSGATMLADQCQNCGGILFRTRDGNIVCPRCEISKIGEKTAVELESTPIEPILTSLENILIKKLSSISSSISENQDVSKIRELVQICNEIISVIERLRNLKK